MTFSWQRTYNIIFLCVTFIKSKKINNKTVYDEPQHLIMSCMDSNGPIAEWVCRRLFRSRTYWLFCCSFAPPLIIIVIIIIINGCWCCFYTDTNVNCGWEMFWILSFPDTIQIFFMFFLWICDKNIWGKVKLPGGYYHHHPCHYFQLLHKGGN